MTNKKTLVIGASTNVSRYSYSAVSLLKENKIDTIAFGIRSGIIHGTSIQQSLPEKDEGIHTISLYIGPKHQVALEDQLISLEPKRIIFNPGTENTSFEDRLRKNGIEALRACTLVMLRTGQY